MKSIRFRFSLRGFLFLILMAGCGFGAFMRWHNDIRDSGNAQLRLTSRSGDPDSMVRVGYTAEPAPGWMTNLVRAWIHADYQRRFSSVSFGGAMKWQLDVAQDFAKSNGVQRVVIDEPKLSPEFAEVFFRSKGIQLLQFRKFLLPCDEAKPVFHALTQATQLEEISLEDGYLCDLAASEIAKLPKLKRLHLDMCNPETLPQVAKCSCIERLHIKRLRSSEEFVLGPGESEAMFIQRSRQSTREMLRTLADRPRFTSLHIEGTLGIRADDLRVFTASTKIQSLSLHSPQMSPECLAEIARCSQLQELQIYDFPIRDEHLPLLKDAQSLKSLTIGPNVSWEAIRQLRSLLPQCTVNRY